MRAAHEGRDLAAEVRGDEENGANAPGARSLGPCPNCRGYAGKTCGACKGEGWVAKPAAEDDDEPDREPGPLTGELYEAAGEFVRAWSQVEAFGAEGFIRVLRLREESPDAAFFDAVGFFQGLLNGMEADDDVRDAIEAANARAANGRK